MSISDDFLSKQAQAPRYYKDLDILPTAHERFSQRGAECRGRYPQVFHGETAPPLQRSPDRQADRPCAGRRFVFLFICTEICLRFCFVFTYYICLMFVCTDLCTICLIICCVGHPRPRRNIPPGKLMSVRLNKSQIDKVTLFHYFSRC